MRERGKFLVSTKTDGTKDKTKAIISGVMFFIFGFIFASESFADFIGSRAVSIFMCSAAFVYALVIMYLTFARLKSYCDIYENGIIGTTVPTLQTKSECFELPYDQISNVTIASQAKAQSIILSANGRTYEVLALENCSQAVSEIKVRIQDK